jgi:hypothetical protein
MDDELVIPPRRLRVFGRSAYSLTRFGVLAACALVIPYLMAERGWFAVLISGSFAVLFAVVAGSFAYRDLRILLSRGLILRSNHFQFLRHRWSWNDVTDIALRQEPDGEGGIESRIVVRFRPECSAPSAPSLTTIDPGDFNTGDEPLALILQQWQRRYGNGSRTA